MKKKVSKIAVISDIHTEDIFLERTLIYLKKLKLDLILTTGDIVDGPGDLEKCYALLKKYGVLGVRGNHERWFLNDDMRLLSQVNFKDETSEDVVKFLEKLPQTFDLKTSLGCALVCHGVGDDDMSFVSPDDYGYAIESNFELQDIINSNKYRFMIAGHSHIPMVKDVKNLTIINGGTLSRYENPGFVVVDFDQKKVFFYQIWPDELYIQLYKTENFK